MLRTRTPSRSATTAGRASSSTPAATSSPSSTIATWSPGPNSTPSLLVRPSRIALCLSKQEAGTRELLEDLLKEEEESVDWLEAQLKLVSDIGRERYLAEQLRD